ncbi:hypothetical protein [Streptomyces canus]|uniref:hypothetical protein n=1 Tax=Streptomyces canus TaxID=58343 RepID=UPI002E26EE93
MATPVDARVLSCEEGRRKPDPELFHLITPRLDTDPQNCLNIGDGDGSGTNSRTGAASRLP